MPSSQQFVGVALLTAYKRLFSPLLHAAAGTAGACRFQPTCSEYALLAISTQGIIRGSLLTLTRCLRCNPLFMGGFDPVPGTYATVNRDAPAIEGCHGVQTFMHTSAPPVTIDKSDPLDLPGELKSGSIPGSLQQLHHRR